MSETFRLEDLQRRYSLNSSLGLVLIYVCPQCGKERSESLSGKGAGDELCCPCGLFSFRFADLGPQADDFQPPVEESLEGG